MTFDGTHIHIIDRIDDNVRMILPPTADGQAPTVYTYTVDGLGNPEGITFDGTHIHIVDRIDDNVRMILPPTSDGQAPTVFTYTVSGLSDPLAWRLMAQFKTKPPSPSPQPTPTSAQAKPLILT